MTEKRGPRDRSDLVAIAQGFFRGKVLCAAVRLGLFDVLTGGPLSNDEIADRIGSSPSALRRLLRALVALGVVAEKDGAFALTDRGELLRRDAENSVWADIVFWADLLDDAWTYLPDCVRAGGTHGAAAARQRHGTVSRWDCAEDAGLIFRRVFTRPEEEMIPYAMAYDFSPRSMAADLGGGGGALLRAILRRYPSLSGLLVDRAESIQAAEPLFRDPAIASRCRLAARDLLDHVPAEPDTYVMKDVLHVYEDDSARRILDNCRSVMTPLDRLLIIETILPDQIDPADTSHERAIMSDISMLAVTGGVERTLSEWQHLLGAARLELGRTTMIANSRRHGLLEAIPA